MGSDASERDPRAAVGARVKVWGCAATVKAFDPDPAPGRILIRSGGRDEWVPLAEVEPPDPGPGTLPVVLLHPDARLPTRGHAGADAGLDLYPVGPVTLDAGEGRLVRTGIAVGIPAGHVGLICGRSGLGSKGVDVLAGVVDHGYGGEVKVMLMSLAQPVVIPAWTAVAQLLVIPVALLAPAAVDSLPESARGSDGFGSTDGKGAANGE